MINQEVKGTLAKLLATENLKVEHRNVTTACFDVDKRVLILPVWEDASNTVYDLLVGHEVGHALYTPNETFDAPKDFVNVIEDARIERMMKKTYPGLRKSFFDGYSELWDRDFFGVRGEDLSLIPFIDRINLYYKGNRSIEFTDEEKVYVDRAAYTKTFADVLQLAKEIYEYAQAKQDEKDQQQAQVDADGGSEGDIEEIEMEQSSLDEMTDEELLEELNKPLNPSTQSQPDPDLDTPSFDAGNTPVGGATHDETKSITEEALRESLETLVSDDAKEWVYLDLPNVNLNDFRIGHKKISEDMEEHFSTIEAVRIEDNLSEYRQYKKSAQKSVNYLVKQFEMKKSADQYARNSVSKTGVIDTNKLHTYRYNEDIFKKINVVPDGKNHGLVMLLDWSGSMSQVLMDTLKQTYNLVWFCKKVNIPFRVYAFQNSFGSYTDMEKDHVKDNNLYVGDGFKLLEFFSSRMNNKKLDRQLQNIWLHSKAMTHYGYYSYHKNYGLGGTPLGEAIMCMRQVVNEMKSVEKVQKVNVVSLTDGEANPLQYVTTNERYYDGRFGIDDKLIVRQMCHSHGKVFVLRDPLTGYTRKFDHNPFKTTQQIVSFYKEITDYNWIGIRLCSKNEMVRTVREHIGWGNEDVLEKISNTWSKEKHATVTGLTGFTKHFFMPNKSIGDGTEDLEVKQKGEVATRAELNRAFKKHMGSKMTNKTILNAFVEQIA
tara:strand:+ start:4077 stop:6215 length:2139 start_codon:yes stop_codon:yes gene_type:complete